MTWMTHTWNILENMGLVCRKSGEGTRHYQPPAWILTGMCHNRSIWLSGRECHAGWHTDTGDIILLRLLKGTSCGRGDEKLCWSAVSWGCWNQTWSIEKCLEERWKAPWFCGLRHSLWWPLLIFYTCIDQFSIVLIPFLKKGIIVLTLFALSPGLCSWNRKRHRRGAVSPVPYAHLFVLLMAGPSKTIVQKQMGCGHLHSAFPDLIPPVVKRMVRGSGVPPALGMQTCHGDRTPLQKGKACVCVMGTPAVHTHQKKNGAALMPLK